MEEKLKKYKELIDLINKYSYQYYTLGDSDISDAEWDRLYLELEIIEKSLPVDLIAENSPTQHVGGEILDGFEKHVHRVPLLSIPIKEKSFSSLQNWYESIGGDGTEVIVEPKCDGITINVTYNDSKYLVSATRGQDGIVGENVTKTVETISSIPKQLSNKFKDIDVRGEAVVNFDRFMKLMKDEYNTARNAISGIIRTLDTSKVKKQRPSVIFYDIVPFDVDLSYDKDNEWVDELRKEGFVTVPYEIVNNYEDLKKLCENRLNGLIKERDGCNVCEYNDFAYLCDGIVIKVNSFEEREEIGFATKGPKWAYAFKFPSFQAHTKINEVIWQVGRSGKLTPVADLNKVNIGGSNINRATLNNIDYMTNLLVLGEKVHSVFDFKSYYLDYTKPIDDINKITPNDILFDTQNYKNDKKEVVFIKVKNIEKNGFYICEPEQFDDTFYLFEKDRYYYVSKWFLENYLTEHPEYNCFDKITFELNKHNCYIDMDFFNDIEKQINETFGLRMDDVVTLERSNDVIPKIINIYHRGSVLYTDDMETTIRNSKRNETFNIPDKCPFCGSLIKEEYPLHFCENINCNARIKNSIIHYCSRTAMNIVGLGEEIVNLFVEKNIVNNLIDIYDLKDKKDLLLSLDKFAEKKVNNLLEAIEKSKDCELYQFIYAIGIREIGLSTAKILAQEFKTLEKFIKESQNTERILNIEDIGEITANHIKNYFSNKNNLDFINDLSKLLNISEVKENGNSLSGLTFVITGTLNHSRDYYKDIIEKNGGKVSGSVSKKTTAILIGKDAGSKEKKAKELKEKGSLIELLNTETEIYNYFNKFNIDI